MVFLNASTVFYPRTFHYYLKNKSGLVPFIKLLDYDIA